MPVVGTSKQATPVKGQQQQLQQQQQQMSSNKQQPHAQTDTKLKTTKVVSKSGGFTEEKLSDAEFKKFLSQCKPTFPADQEIKEPEKDSDNKKMDSSKSLAPSGPNPKTSMTKTESSSALVKSTPTTAMDSKQQASRPHLATAGFPSSASKSDLTDNKQCQNQLKTPDPRQGKQTNTPVKPGEIKPAAPAKGVGKAEKALNR